MIPGGNPISWDQQQSDFGTHDALERTGRAWATAGVLDGRPAMALRNRASPTHLAILLSPHTQPEAACLSDALI